MATIDEEMSQLEKDIRQLKIEYDHTLAAAEASTPEIEWRIELIIKRYGERGGDMKFGQRFRYNNLSQTYASTKTFSARSFSRKKKEKCSAILAPPPSHRSRARQSCGGCTNQQRPQ